MFLRSLSLKGFKSFADRARLEFRPGVTVVVGPNGSGKTTVINLIVGDNLQAYAQDVRLFGQRRGSGESIQMMFNGDGFVVIQPYEEATFQSAGS